MRRRIAAIFLATFLITGSISHAFTDIQNHWAKEQINYLTQKGLVFGYPEDIFLPEGLLTREESAAIISRLIGEKLSSNNSLSDIEGRWSTNSIKNLINERIISGYPDGTFKPTENITRAEFATLVYRYLKSENRLALGESLKDVNDIENNWAEDYIHVLLGMGIVSGYPDGNFLPNNYIKRSEASAMIANILAKEDNITFNFNSDEDIKKEEILRFIEKNYNGKYDINQLRQMSIKEIFNFLGDENSKYMDINSYQNFKANLKGEFIGIGVHLMSNKDDKIEVFYVVENSPATRAGIKAGDIIESVDGVKYQGYEVFALTRKLNGIVGTSLNLGILFKDESGNYIKENKTLVREAIKINTVFPRVLSDSIGYVRITQFEHPTYSDYASAVQELKSKGIKALILDLRYNGGGIVGSARAVADSLIGEGNIYCTKNTDGTTNYIQATSDKLGLPTVILVNGVTASASELIVAAAKDHKVATIVGEKTYGKGTIQTVVDLPDGTGFKLTIGEYYSPDGNRIHGVGIQPDILVEMGSVENIGPDSLAYDYQLQKAIEILK